jgi:hypothetical protein
VGRFGWRHFFAQGELTVETREISKQKPLTRSAMGQSSSSLTPEMAAQIKTEVDTLVGMARSAPVPALQTLAHPCPMLGFY